MAFELEKAMFKYRNNAAFHALVHSLADAVKGGMTLFDLRDAMLVIESMGCLDKHEWIDTLIRGECDVERRTCVKCGTEESRKRIDGKHEED